MFALQFFNYYVSTHSIWCLSQFPIQDYSLNLLKYCLMKLLFSILILFSISMASAQQTQRNQYGAIYTDCEVDTLPKFGQGEEDLYAFFEQRVHPTHLITGDDDNVTLFAVLKLYISPLGLLDSSEFQSSSSVYLEKAISRSLDEMPPWKPAKKEGVAVATHVYVPLKFTDAGGYFIVANSGIHEVAIRNQGFSFLKAVLAVGAIILFSKLVFGW